MYPKIVTMKRCGAIEKLYLVQSLFDEIEMYRCI